MQEKRASQRRPAKFRDTKALLAATSVAITLGLWNLFSHDAVRGEKANPASVNELPPKNAEGLDLPPLPTLAPLVSFTMPDSNLLAGQGQHAQEDTSSATRLPLRSVPSDQSPVIVQKIKPIVDIPVSESSGNSDNGGVSQPVTSTQSSK